jgi:hypothetical protein
MECMVYFDVVHANESKTLRGLIYLQEKQQPSEQDYLSMFADMGYTLRVEKRDPWIFVPVSADAGFREIRVRRLDTGDAEDRYDDHQLKNVVANLLPNKPKSL